MVDRDDDLKIGMKTSAITLGRLDCGRRDGVFIALPGADGLGAAALWPGLASVGRLGCGGSAGGVALHADPQPPAAGLLYRIQQKPLDGRSVVCRDRAGVCAALTPGDRA